MITKEQLRYIVKVYPMRVTQEEAKAEFDKVNMDSVDRDYWQKATDLVNEYALSHLNEKEVK
jgi:hypothetical protein